MKTPDPIKSLQKWLYENLPIYDHINATVEEIGEQTRCRVPLNTRNKNHFGAVHAALQFAVMELAGGLAGNRSPVLGSDEYLLVVKSFNIEFLKPAMTDVEAVVHLSDDQLHEIEDSLKETGRAKFELDGELHNAAGEIVAKTVAVYHASRRIS